MESEKRKEAIGKNCNLGFTLIIDNILKNKMGCDHKPACLTPIKKPGGY